MIYQSPYILFLRGAKNRLTSTCIVNLGRRVEAALFYSWQLRFLSDSIAGGWDLFSRQRICRIQPWCDCSGIHDAGDRLRAPASSATGVTRLQ